MERKQPIAVLSALLNVASNIRNPWLDKAVKEGRPAVGCFYSEIPEEILTAAGCIPVMMRGTTADGIEQAEAYFRQLTCNHTRCTFNQILQGEWDFLAGAVIYNNCDHMRRIYDNWKLLPNSPVYHFLYVPKKHDPLAKGYYAEQIKLFVEATEKKFGVKITDEKLNAAIALHNRIRGLQRQIYDMQKGDAVALTGDELISVMLAGTSMPREDYAEQLELLIQALKESDERFTPTTRLLYLGGHADSRRLFRLFNTHGADIVADDLGFGTRSCDCSITATGSPLQDIIDFYFDQKPQASRQLGRQRERMQRIVDLAREYKAGGVVMTRVAMCDIWAFEQLMARDYLKQHGLPLLELEVSYLPGGDGQISTRAQAFVESIAAKNEIKGE
jgi:benzoyl-CoA reductase/2-hydroxyglutaryl-CoA dehydratase subunit BcrC/BadD/HgdB